MQNQTIASPITTERRSAGDRRKNGFNLNFRTIKVGRRKMLRRMEDRRRIYLLDYYSPRIFYAVTMVLLLSVTDALLTLWLVDSGAQELNPVMAYFLKSGPMIFMAAKYVLTAISVVIIILFHYICIRKTRFPMGHLLNFFAGCFAMTVAWELLLIFRHLR